jgi:hypothetical protein
MGLGSIIRGPQTLVQPLPTGTYVAPFGVPLW